MREAKYMNENVEQEISLLDLYYLLKRNILIIVGFVLVFGLAAGIFGFVSVSGEDSVYQSNAHVVIDNRSHVIATEELFQLPTVLENTAERLNRLNYDWEVTPSMIRNGLSIDARANNIFIDIRYESHDPMFTQDVVNFLIEEGILYADERSSLLGGTIERGGDATLGTAVASGTNPQLYIAIGIVLGGMVGVGLVFVREFLDDTIKSKEQLEALLGHQVIGVVPNLENKGRA